MPIVLTLSPIPRFKYWRYTCFTSDKLKIKVNEGAIMFADNFKILAGILSKPVALHAFGSLRVEATLSTSIGKNFKNVPEYWSIS